jgi:hypothetical protein
VPAAAGAAAAVAAPANAHSAASPGQQIHAQAAAASEPGPNSQASPGALAPATAAAVAGGHAQPAADNPPASVGPPAANAAPQALPAAAQESVLPAPATSAGTDRASRENAGGGSSPPVPAPAAAPNHSPAVAASAVAAPNADPGGSAAAAVAASSVAVAESAGAAARPRYPPSPAVAPVAAERAPQGDGPDPVDGGSTGKRLPDPSEFKYLKEAPRRPSASRALLVGIAMVAVITGVVVFLVTSGSSGSPSSTPHNVGRTTHRGAGSVAHHATGAGSSAGGPAALHVAVLNSTEINGLAHRVATTLQEHGFQQAQALQGHPTGTYSTTVIEYAPGHVSDAERVARALGVEAGALRPMEAAAQPLTPGATVVVIAAGGEGSGGSTG